MKNLHQLVARMVALQEQARSLGIFEDSDNLPYPDVLIEGI
jgi:hypothetical protein